MIDHRLNFCYRCSYKELGDNKEICCKLTHQKPDFQDDCANYLFNQRENDRLVEARKDFLKLKTFGNKSLIQKIVSGRKMIEPREKSVDILRKEHIKNVFYKMTKQELIWELCFLAVFLVVLILLFSQLHFVSTTSLIIASIILELIYFGYGTIKVNTKILNINEQGIYCKKAFYDWHSILLMHIEETEILRNVSLVYLVISRVQLYEPVKIFLGVNYITSEIERSILFYSGDQEKH